MVEYYCEKCKKLCNFDEEIELREAPFSDEWEEYHAICDEAVVVRLIHATN